MEAVSTLTAAAVESIRSAGVCSVENVMVHPTLTSQPSIDNGYKAPASGAVKFIGFATNLDKGEPLGSFTLLLVGPQHVFGVPSSTGLERPDVASHFNHPALSKAGYQVDASLKNVIPGTYQMWMRAADGVVCPTHQRLIVQGA